MYTTRLLAFVIVLLAGVACSSGATGSSSSPGPSASGIAAGGYSNCAKFTSGAVRCWGANDYGQLGSPAGLGHGSFVPVMAASVTAPVQLVAGGLETCARLASGVVECWGWGLYGQLGNGQYGDSNSPVTVSGVANAIDMDAGFEHACAVVAGGAVRCWGYNNYGQLGDPTNVPTTGPTNRSANPVTVVSVSGATAVVTGGLHSCALLGDRSVKCWGGSFNGPPPYDPVAIASLANVTAIAAGFDHDCAILTGGAVKCWARNNYGQLGDGAPGIDSPTEAVFVTSIATATAVTAGLAHSCAVLDGGTVVCWGRNNFGQLGDGTYTNRPTPVPVSGVTGATAVAAGDYHTCALLTGGQVQCWGDNSRGELGVDPAVIHTSAVPVTINF